MGYAETQKGYILYDLTNHVFFVNRDVIFKEGTFPFKLQSKKSDPPFTFTGINHTPEYMEQVQGATSEASATLNDDAHYDMSPQIQDGETSMDTSTNMQQNNESEEAKATQEPIRKSVRGIKPSLWMKDFVP